MPLCNETELLDKLAADDELAFELIYKHHICGVTAFLNKFLKSSQLADDIAQEIFIKIWEDRSKMQRVQSLKAYLYITARNRALNILKSTSKSLSVMSEILRHYRRSQNETENSMLDYDYRQFLLRIIEKLPSRSREVFQLCRDQGKSYEEVAEILGISTNSVKSHMVLSMKRLKASVEQELGISFGVFLVLLYSAH